MIKKRLYQYKFHLLVLLVLLGALLTLFLVQSRQKKILRLGVYAGSSWDVPSGKDYQFLDSVIKRFEKAHPNVDVQYETGILKEDYSSWLSKKIVEGKQPDVFMVPENDFNLLASTKTLANLDSYIKKDLKPSLFYHSAYNSGQFERKQFALPFESNPVMMCVNKDLLEKEGISIPDSNWTLEDLYAICQKVTKDTNGDGLIDQYGITDYTWKQALVAYNGHLRNQSGVNVDSAEMHQALSFISKLDSLNQRYKVTSNDFDEGKVAFYPMSLAQYRTYKPYPYHVAKYSRFSWTCIPMPAAKAGIPATQVKTSLFAMSSKTKQDKLAWEFMKLLGQNQKNQQELFAKSQGTSVLTSVVKSSQTKKILQADDFGLDSLTSQRLDHMMKHSVLDISRDLDYHSLERLDYLLGNALKNNEIDSILPSIQREMEETGK